MLHYYIIRFFIRVFQKLLKIVCLYLPNSKNTYNVFKPNDLKLTFPENIKFLRIDVGLSDDASHSVDCLIDHDDRAIIGIEPHPDNIQNLKSGTHKFHSISLDGKYVRKGHNIKKLENIQNFFYLIQGAAGNVRTITKRNFYSSFPDRGNSGFYNTQSEKASGFTVDQVITVDEFPLSALLKQIDFNRFGYIETLKIDTEGHDLEVLKGCGKYLAKVLFCRVECFKGIYPQTQFLDKSKIAGFEIFGENGYYDSASAIIEFLRSKKFYLISTKPGDYVFLNSKLASALEKSEVYPG